MAINYRFICYHLTTDIVMRLSPKKYRSNSKFVYFDYFIFVHISVIMKEVRKDTRSFGFSKKFIVSITYKSL